MNKLPLKLQPWFDARKKFKLSHAEIQMARELGLNPQKFGGIANHQQESWKVPIGQFITNCYRKSFGRDAPAKVVTLEEVLTVAREKKLAKAARKSGESYGEGTRFRIRNVMNIVHQCIPKSGPLKKLLPSS